MSADILFFPGNPGAPVEPLKSRQHFGRRKAGFLAGGFAEVLDVACGRPDDRAAQDRIKRLAREARAALGDNSHVHPSLLAGLAARIAGLAIAADQLGAEAKSYGLLKAAVQLREHAGLLELLAAETDPTPPEQPA